MYIPGYFEDYMEELFETMEVVMGVDYDNSPHSSKTGENDNIISLGINSGEGCFVANSYRNGYVCEEDLLLGKTNNLLRTMVNVFEFVETRWDHNDLYESGIDVYSMYKILKYLEANNVELAKALSHYSSKNLLADYVMHEEDYTKLMVKDMEYWIRNVEQTWNVTGNGYFSIGIRFFF